MRSRALAVVNRWVPAGTGTPILLYELFRHFQPDSVSVLAGPGLRPRSELELPFSTRRLTFAPLDRWFSGGYRALGQRALPMVRAAVEWAVAQEKPDTLYTHFPDAVFATAAAQVARRHRIPLVMNFDVLWGGFHAHGMGYEYESLVCHTAHRRFAITESHCEYLARRHGLAFDLMPHVIVPPSPRPAAVPLHKRRSVVHFAGNIYPEMNGDAVQRLHQALAHPRYGALRLELLGFTPPAELARLGLSGPQIETGSAPRHELLERQRTARMLYLPEAFSSSEPEMIRHNFPTKALEYMLTGTPILVHAPKDSYLARAAREHRFGLLVDRPDVAALQAGLDRLLAGGSEVNEHVERAWAFAVSRDGRRWSRLLQEALRLESFEVRPSEGVELQSGISSQPLLGTQSGA